MENNKKTDPIKFYAQPDNDVTIKLKSDGGAIFFDPPIFTISHPATQSEFTMRATKPGRHSISYEISGSDAVFTRNPSPKLKLMFSLLTKKTLILCPWLHLPS